MREDTGTNVDAKEGKSVNEEEEGSVVTTTDTVANPGTVVVEGVDAVVANTTMNCPRWAEEATGVAPLQLDRLLAYGYIFGHILYHLTRHKGWNCCVIQCFSR